MDKDDQTGHGPDEVTQYSSLYSPTIILKSPIDKINVKHPNRTFTELVP